MESLLITKRSMRYGVYKMRDDHSHAVSHTISYIMISSIVAIMLVVTGLTATNVFVTQPAETLMYYSFIDIANGVSTRIVDISCIAPPTGIINTTIDLPDEVAGYSYNVGFWGDNETKHVSVYYLNLNLSVPLSGVAGSRTVSGNISGRRLSKVTYNSSRG